MLKKILKNLKRKRPSNFLTVISKLEKIKILFKDAKIEGCSVYPEIYHSSQINHKPSRVIIKLYTNKGTIEVNTCDCDIEFKFISIEN